MKGLHWNNNMNVHSLLNIDIKPGFRERLKYYHLSVL